jgi:hypothetical protein
MLCVRFPAPGFFLTDCEFEVDVDGSRIYEGSFRDGFERELPIAPGDHELVTRIRIGPVLRPKRYRFHVDAGPRHTATLVYSRFWGNFSRKLKLERA